MPSKIEDTYCIDVGDNEWCAVLGNHYPNFPGNLVKESDSDEVFFKKTAEAKTWCTQRLCDQTLVQYEFVVIMAPTCKDCLRIKALMVEFARPQESDHDREDDPDEPAELPAPATDDARSAGESEGVLQNPV